MNHYLLFYTAGDGYLQRREAHRSLHLELAWNAYERGDLILGGALVDPVDAAVLLFKGTSPEVAEEFARNDPYVINGLVREWHVREWATVVGTEAATPVRPRPQ